MEASPPEQEKKKRGAQKGRVMTDAQREGLKKGFEALKLRREALKKEKEDKNVPLTNTKPITEPLPTNNLPVANKELVNPAPTLIPKKTRNRVPALSRDDFNDFKREILNGLRPQPQPQVQPSPIVVEASQPQPQPQPKAEIPKIISGHDLLNKIFFNR